MRLLGGEAAADLAAAAGDRFADHRGAQHLAVEDDGEALPDILRRQVGEAPRALRVEAEIDDGLAGALIEAGLRVDQTVAADLGPLVHDDAFGAVRSEEHTSELQSLMRISYAVFCLKKKNENNIKSIKSM